VRNHCLAKSINDAGCSQFRVGLEYFSNVFGRATIAVNPAYRFQECSNFGVIVKKSLSTRTHVCRCGCKLDRAHNAAINILKPGLGTVGHTGTQCTLMQETLTLTGIILSQASDFLEPTIDRVFRPESVKLDRKFGYKPLLQRTALIVFLEKASRRLLTARV
jgi:hypothetical protein